MLCCEPEMEDCDMIHVATRSSDINTENLPSLLKRNTKPKRRSSILKTTKPLEELQNISSRDDRLSKDRRVSFANTIKIKEFLPNKASKEENGLGLEGGECDDEITTVNLQDGKETTIQISTPKGKKCRRISVNTGSKMERFSLIPKLDRSFSYCESDEDFEIFEEDSKASVAALASTVLAEVPLEPSLDHTLGLTLTENDFGVDVTRNDYISPSANTTHQVSHLVKENEVSDMELTNCETTVHASGDSPRASLCLCSPESLLKPLRARETTVLHPSEHEHLATNETLSNPTACSHLTSLPDEDHSRLTNVTMEFTCQHTAQLSINANVHSECEVTSFRSTTHPPNTNNKSKDDHSSCNLDMNIPVNIHTPSQSIISSDQCVTRVPPHPLKLKQTPSKTMLLLASPYSETPHREGIVHVDTPLADGDMHCGNTTADMCSNKSLVPSYDSQHILINQENILQKCKEDEAISLQNSDIEHEPCHDHSSPVVLNDDHHNWLQNTNHSGFALVPVSCSPAPLTPASTVSQSNPEIRFDVTSTDQLFALPLPPASLVDELTAASTTEAVTSDETLVINSPQVIPVKYGMEPNVSGDIHSLSFIGDLSTSLVRQSLGMSPSIFSKFLTKLDCDKSIPVDKSDIINENASDTVSMLSSSLATTHITDSSDRVNSDEDKDSSMTSPGTIGTFSALLEKLTKRISFALHLIQLRLNNKEYLQAHTNIQPCLRRLLTAINRCFCALNILRKFGILSGLSSAPFDLSILKLMSEVDKSGSDLRGDSQTKAKWILNMHHHLQRSVYPTVEFVLRQAARIFPWHIDTWTETAMEIICHDRCQLRFDLSKPNHGAGSMCIDEVRVSTVQGILVNERDLICSTTNDIPKMLQKICFQE